MPRVPPPSYAAGAGHVCVTDGAKNQVSAGAFRPVHWVLTWDCR